MATDKEFTDSLSCFKARRAYGALERDFLVPIGTSTFLHDAEREALLYQYNSQHGILTILDTNKCHFAHHVGDDCDTLLFNMIESLNSLGWEKVVVNFPGVLPFSHIKICSNGKYKGMLEWFYELHHGYEVMEHVANWVIGELQS